MGERLLPSLDDSGYLTSLGRGSKPLAAFRGDYNPKEDEEGLISNSESDECDENPELNGYVEQDREPVHWTPDSYHNVSEVLYPPLCSLSSNIHAGLASELLTAAKLRTDQSIKPRPAIVATTWCDFTGPQEEELTDRSHSKPQNQDQYWFETPYNQNQQTFIAEHAIGKWDVSARDNTGNKKDLMVSMPEYYHENYLNKDDIETTDGYHDLYFDHQTLDEEALVAAEPTTEAIVSENISTEKESAKEEVDNENSGNVLVRRKSSRRKRVFQKFWCATEEDEDLIELPRPDEYRLKSQEKGGSQKRKKRSGSSIKRRLLGKDPDNDPWTDELNFVGDGSDERGGIRRLPKIWDSLDDELEKEEKFYAPKRPPPILDFLMVVTSFLAASILAYYSVT